MRPMSQAERKDVSDAVAELKQAKTDWRRTAAFAGEYTARPILPYIRSAVRELRHYVRASREHGIDLMPTLRNDLAGALVLVEGRHKPSRLYHPRAAADAAQIIAAIRNA